MQKLNSILKLTLLGLCLAVAASPVLGAESAAVPGPAASPAELLNRLEELQAQIDSLQAEVSAVQGQLVSANTESAPAPEAAVSAPEPSNAPEPNDAPAPAAVTAPQEPAMPAEESKDDSFLGSIQLSGFVDGYYGLNFNHPHSRETPFRAFDVPSDQFSLNMIELILNKDPDAAKSRLGFYLAFGYGNGINVVNSFEPGGMEYAKYLKEGYVSYLAPVGENGLQFDFGKFVTPHGAELIESKDNWNYSRGILFTWAIPFYHFGMRTTYQFNDKASVSGFLVNGWNNIVDNNTGKTYGVSLSLTPHPKVSLIQNYMAGPETADLNQNWRQLSDTVVTISPTDKLSFMVNYDYGRGDRMAGLPDPVSWSGVAGYLHYMFDSRYSMTARYEWFNDPDGFSTGTVQQVKEFTWTLERIIAEKLITRFEYRYDYSNEPTFVKGDQPVSSQNTLALGLIYTFDSSER